jgi:hypothetical protein
MNKKLTIIGLIIFVILVIATQGYFTYSEGERSGYVRRLSRTGYVFKTYEGELVQQVDGVYSAQAFPFSVQNKKVVKQIEEAIRTNERINVRYKQKKYIIGFLHGDTQYFITEVTKSQ